MPLGTSEALGAARVVLKRPDHTPPGPPLPDSPEPRTGGCNAEVDFFQRLSNDTHRSTADPEARRYRKDEAGQSSST